MMEKITTPPRRLSSLLALYLQTHKKQIKSSTAAWTQRAFEKLFQFVDDIEISQITELDAELFQSNLIEVGLRKSSANSYLKAVKTVFHWGEQHKFVEADVFQHLNMFKVTPKPATIFEVDEFERLLAACYHEWWRAMIWLGRSSLRMGEALNLIVSDIDFKRETISITPKSESDHTWEWEPKDYELRLLPLVPELSKLLINLYNNLPNGQPYLMIKADRYRYLMQLRKEGRLSDRMRQLPVNSFPRSFRALCSRALVKGTFRDLRSTAITAWMECPELEPHDVQGFAGHSSIRTTLGYTKRRTLLNAAREAIRGVAQFG